jgi:hypothetical protein
MSPQQIEPLLAPVLHISITLAWCCGSSALAFAAAEAFLSNSYRYFPLGQCFRSAVSAGRTSKRDTSARRRSSTTENWTLSQSRYCAPSLSLTPRALRIVSHRRAPLCCRAPFLSAHAASAARLASYRHPPSANIAHDA